MACRRWMVLAFGLLACQREAGVYVQLIAASDVPALDRVHVMVLQNGELLQQDLADFPLTGVRLPQTVRISSRADTPVEVDVVAQGFSGELVQARGEVPAMLGREQPYQEVTLVLVRACSTASCTLKPTSCNAQGATCGTVDDSAGGFLNCGVCASPQICGGGGAHHCGASLCTPSVTCAATSASCGYVFDGCKLISCGSCTAPAACTLDHACACAPTRTCGGSDGGCSMLDDGCGHTLQCGKCGCMPDCASKACGADDGCGGVCMGGSCPTGETCVAGTCGCSQGRTQCPGSDCRDLMADPDNCGSCGHVCTGTRACAGGQCVCQTPLDNNDGHCCPSGFTFENSAGGKGPYCYAEPGFATNIDGAEELCTSNSGSCVGFGGGMSASFAVPASADCGTYLVGRGGVGTDPQSSVVGTYVGGSAFLGSTVCGPCDGGDSCSCGSCSCSKLATDCKQRFYCVTDPLAPRRAMCTADDDCPAGTTCSAGACVSDPSYGCCVGAVRCTNQMQGTCMPSGARATGQCR